MFSFRNDLLGGLWIAKLITPFADYWPVHPHPLPLPLRVRPLPRHRLLPPPPTAQVCLRTLHLFIGSGGGRAVRGVGWRVASRTFVISLRIFVPLSLSSRLLAERKRGNNCTYLKLPRGRRRDALSPLRHLTCGHVSGNLDSDSLRVNLRRGRKRSELFETDIHTNIPCLSVLDQQCMCMRFRLLPSGFRMGMFHVNSRRRRSSRSQSSVSDEDFAIPASCAKRDLCSQQRPLSVCLKQV